MGQAQIMNDPNKFCYPILYKGTTLANYKEACHVLSSNNCVLMDDFFLRKGNIEAVVVNKFNEDFEIGGVDDEPDEESLLDEETLLDYVLSPVKNHNDLSRFQNNIMTYVSHNKTNYLAIEKKTRQSHK